MLEKNKNLIVKNLSVLLLYLIVIICLIINPRGLLSPDPIVQFYQALTSCYNDWHPPIMAFLWKKLFDVFKIPSILYYFHLALFLIGTLLIIKFLKRKSILLSIFFIIILSIVCFYERFIFYIWKDTGMFCSNLVIIGIVLLLPYLKNLKLKYFLCFVGIILNFYVMGIRANTVFSGLIMITLLLSNFSNNLLKSTIIGFLIWLGTIFSINLITYDYLKSEKFYPIRYIMVSDIYQICYRNNNDLPLFLQGYNYSKKNMTVFYDNIPNINKYVIEKIVNIPGGPELRSALLTQQNIYKISKEDLKFYIEKHKKIDMIQVETSYKLIKEYWFKIILENPITFLKIKIKYFIGLIGIPMICLMFINLILQYIYSIKRKNIKQLLIYLSSCFYLWPYFIFNASYDYRYITYCVLIEVFMFVYIVYTNIEEVFEKIKKLKFIEREWMDEK